MARTVGLTISSRSSEFLERYSLMSAHEIADAFLSVHTEEETVRRLGRVNEWLKSINIQNVTGVRLTPVIVDRLSSQEDIDSVIGELNSLRTKTSNGEFDYRNPVQRDLEFHRFLSIDNRLNSIDVDSQEQYQRFLELTEAPSSYEHEYCLDDESKREAMRAAYEAYCLFRFLEELRSKTDRRIVVVGNHRYGRHWLVEPIEHLLNANFDLRYDRVPSHHSWTLTVPHQLDRQVISGFPPEFIREMGETMPHMVLVDVSSPNRVAGVTKYTRALRDYVNWFIAFNDVRRGGDNHYENDSTMPKNHFPELREWYEYVIVKRNLTGWIKPGPVYRVAHWAPELHQKIRLGDLVIPKRAVDFSSRDALVVLANPSIYRMEGDDLPKTIKGTHPYYFNDPEKHVSAKVVLGFGAFGLASRVEGTTTDQFVAVVQKHIKKEVDRLVESGAMPLSLNPNI